ncbi:MAG: hypothetical protein IKF64_04970 [Eubacterium sp.]|nr:hypothetical protein [Eubacterium sp.]
MSSVDQLSSGQQTASSVISLIVWVLSVIAMWKLFEKAGEAGWKSLIPLYNAYVFCKIVDGNGLKFLLFLIPGVNIVYYIIFSLRTAKAYGQSTGFGVGLILLPNIFTLILGFGSSTYVGPQGK